MYTENITPKKLGSFLWLFLKDYKFSLIIFVVASLINAIEFSLSPYLLKIIIDRVVATANNSALMLSLLLWPVIGYVSLAMILNVNWRLVDYTALRMIPNLKANISVSMFDYLSKHSYRYFSEEFSGNLSKKILDLSLGIEAIVQIPVVQFMPVGFSILTSSFILYTVHPVFALILLVWAFVFIGFSFKMSKRSEQYAYDVSDSDNILSGKMVDSITNIMNAKLFSNLTDEKQIILDSANSFANKDRLLQWNMLITFFVQGTMVAILSALMLGALIYGRTHNWVTVGDFALIMTISSYIIMSVWNIGQNLIRFSKEIGTCRQALNIIVDPHEVEDHPEAKILKISKGEISFEDVGFQYKGTTPLFKDMNIRIEPGQKIGLVGHSGSGKSSFVNLILRLFDINHGKICIDDQDISGVTQDSLRRTIGMIPQEAALFHRTLLENIRYGRIEATDEEVIEAAKKAHAHEFISILPEGYDTLAGERGVKLSGGQRQRIAIARAFLKNAPILILDEATSQLDSVTENYIQASLWELMQGKTTLVIAHRLSTLLHMDRILVFDKGVIKEDGTHQELLEKNGLYAELWQAQVGGFLGDESNKES